MKLLLKLVFAAVLLFSLSPKLTGQPPPEIDALIEQRQEALMPKARNLVREFSDRREQALRMAAQRGWTLEEALPDGGIMSLQRIDDNGMPVYYITHFNTRAAATISTNHLWPGGRSGLNLSGSLPALSGRLGVWDGGCVLNTHQEFLGRVINEEANVSPNDHATHVAGTIMATGVSALARGMAFGAPNVRSWNFTNHSDEMLSASPSLLVSNHSYGTVAGWRFNSARAGTATNPHWEWHGDAAISPLEDHKFGYYDEMAMFWDMLAFYNPHYLMVKSAGNNRNQTGPDAVTPFWRRNIQGQWELVAQRPAGMSSNDGFDIIATYGNAKNILTVGAADPIAGGFRRPGDAAISSFSSFGPTDDGRIKPDITANGVNLYSPNAQGNTAYQFMSGTSMSAPNVSGSLMLLQELFHMRNQRFMLSSTLRGLVCHSASDAGNPGPDYIFGWGMMNTEAAAMAIRNMGQSSLIEELSLQTGAQITRTVVASGAGPLIVTIAWTDPEIAFLPLNAAVLNNRTPRLVNDLDVRVSDGTTNFTPWVLDPNFPAGAATRGDNRLDNIEQIIIPAPVPGRTYTITVSHKGASLVRGPQIFSLIATGVGAQAVCQSGATQSEGARIDRVRVGAINSTTNTGCSTYRDLTNLVARFNIGATVPFTITTGTCTVENPRVMKLFADWNSSGTFETGELLATSPVITTSGDFAGQFTVPQMATAGSTVLFRVVLRETSHPDSVAACGAFLRGETQDFRFIIDPALRDLSALAIAGVQNNACAVEAQSFSVMIDNQGVSDVSGVQVQVQITENGNPLQAFSETVPLTIPSFSSLAYRLRTTFSTRPHAEYRITVTTVLADDANAANNSTSITFNTAPLPKDIHAEASRCGQQPRVNLRAVPPGFMFWYDRAVSGSLLAAGNNTAIAAMPATGRIFAGLNNFSGRIGPATKNTQPWTGGTYTRATAHPIITTHVPLVIESARLYVGFPGLVTFFVQNLNSGEIVSTATIFVEATRTVPTPEVPSPDDPLDQGRVYQLNLHIPTPGNYRITIEYGEGTTLFRNNASTGNPYPYSIPNVMDIVTTSATGTPTAFYYWFYDMHITGLGCPASPFEVLPQTRPVPLVDLAGTQRFVSGRLVLDAGNPGATFRWNTGDTTQTISPTTPGFFAVTVTNRYGCQTQDGLNVTVTSVHDPHEINARVYPNPATTSVRLTSPTPVHVELFNNAGQRLMTSGNAVTDKTFDVSQLMPGLYFIRITEVTSGHAAMFKVIVH